MSRHGKTLVCVLSGLALGFSARAAVPDAARNPYDKIPQRNVFKLKQPEEVKPPPPQEVPLPKITLTGITTLLGLKRAVLQVQVPARPGEPAREESYILAEGQREGEIEVLQIDEDGGVVKIK